MQNIAITEQRKAMDEREAFRAAKAKIEQALNCSVADKSLETYAKSYTKRVPIRECDRFGRMQVKGTKTARL